MSAGFLKTWRLRVASAAFLAAAAATTASASTFGFTGAFALDNDLQSFTFTVANDGDVVEIRNWGYGGGSFAADAIDGGAGGTVSIAAGNFDGRLTLFDSAGVNIAMNENTGYFLPPPLGPATPVLNALPVAIATSADPADDDTYYAFYDPELRLALDAGTYTLILSQYENAATGGVAAPFSKDGAPNYTVTDPLYSNQCAAGYFCDQIAYDTGVGYNRDAAYALEIMGAESASVVTNSVPVPAALPLLAVAIGALGFLGTRKRA